MWQQLEQNQILLSSKETEVQLRQSSWRLIFYPQGPIDILAGVQDSMHPDCQQDKTLTGYV